MTDGSFARGGNFEGAGAGRRPDQFWIEAEDLNDRVELDRVFRAVWRRKWMIALITVLLTAIFFGTTVVQPSKYTSRATVVLDAREQQVVAAQDQVVSDLKLNNSILESEVALLRSTALLEVVIRRIGINRFDIIDPALAKPSLLDRITTRLGSLVSNSPDTPENATTRPSLLTPEERRMNRITIALNRGIQIARMGDSYVIQISVTTTDPELSMLVANTLVESYIDAQLEERKRVAESATRWLAEQVAERREEVVSIEGDVEALKRTQLDQSGSSVEVLEQQLAEMNQQLAIARSERATEMARLKQINAVVDSQGITAAAETQTSPYISSLRASRSELIREDARLAGTLGPEHSSRRKIASELEEVNRSIDAELRNVIASHENEVEILRTREASLQSDVDRLEERLSDIATSSLRLRQLEREAEAARSSYEELTGRLGEIRAQTEIQRAEAKMVNVAQIPGGPSSPRVKLMTGFGATLGLTLGVVLALVLELFRTGFVQSAELERATGLPVLSIIPKEKFQHPYSVLRRLGNQHFSLFAERIRQLRTMLTIRVSRESSHSILVISSLPDEGKTATSLALAQTYALSGKKTILLDLDTRRSTLHSSLRDSKIPDLADYVVGKVPLNKVCVQVRPFQFWVAGTGKHKALMADSVSLPVIENMVAELKTQFEIIIIDVPPVLAVSDGLPIASIVDSILYLVRYKKTPRKSVSYGLAALRNAGLKPAGIVLTMAEIDADPDVYAGDYTY